MGPLSQETQLFVARSTLVAYFLSKTVGGPKKLYYKSPTQRRDVAATYAKPWSVLPEHNQGIGRYYMTFEILKRNRAALQYKANACEHRSKGLPRHCPARGPKQGFITTQSSIIGRWSTRESMQGVLRSSWTVGRAFTSRSQQASIIFQISSVSP